MSKLMVVALAAVCVLFSSRANAQLVTYYPPVITTPETVTTYYAPPVVAAAQPVTTYYAPQAAHKYLARLATATPLITWRTRAHDLSPSTSK